jgi:hypothetical protein
MKRGGNRNQTLLLKSVFVVAMCAALCPQAQAAVTVTEGRVAYMPVNGDDGFAFTRIEGDVYDFTRTKGN